MKMMNEMDLTGNKVVNLADPSAATDAANKQYVDNVGRGAAWKDPVRVATTANGTLSTAFANGQSVDGVTLATGDRVLLKNQSAGAENGIYVVAASGAPSRAVDADDGTEMKSGCAVYVIEGTANGDKAFAIDTSVVARKVSANIGNGSSTSIAVTHNLGTKDVTVAIRANADDAHVLADVVSTDINTVTITFATAPASNAYRVTVVG